MNSKKPIWKHPAIHISAILSALSLGNIFDSLIDIKGFLEELILMWAPVSHWIFDNTLGLMIPDAINIHPHIKDYILIGTLLFTGHMRLIAYRWSEISSLIHKHLKEGESYKKKIFKFIGQAFLLDFVYWGFVLSHQLCLFVFFGLLYAVNGQNIISIIINKTKEDPDMNGYMHDQLFFLMPFIYFFLAVILSYVIFFVG